jgi:hypothetical protein
MLNRTTLAALSTFVALLTLSCTDDDSGMNSATIYGSGILENESRSLPAVHSIDLRLPGDVNLTYGQQQAISVTADDNVLEHIETVDSSGILIIRQAAGISLSDYDLTVNLTLTDLQGIVCSAPGTIESTNTFEVESVGIELSSSGLIILDVDADVVSTLLSGIGPITLTGAADVHSIVLSGTGTVQASELNTGVTNVVLSGTGNVYVMVSDLLDVELSGTGSVYYQGNPAINSHITGEGGIIGPV